MKLLIIYVAHNLAFMLLFCHLNLGNLLQNSTLTFANALHPQKVCFSRGKFAGLPFVPLPLSLLFNSLLNLFFLSVESYSVQRTVCVCVCVLVAQSPSLMSLSCLLSCLINSRALNICFLCLQSQCHFLSLLSFISLCPSQYLSILFFSISLWSMHQMSHSCLSSSQWKPPTFIWDFWSSGVSYKHEM